MAKLLSLHLENYRNLKSIDINFEGKDGKIVGANRIGKTNCIEAICYLLTDKLLGGSADIASIKNHSDTRAKVVVEGTFFTSDGTITLRKEFYEKWVRPRGSATEELQGHATDYYINGAKQSRAKDFLEALEKKFGIPTEFSGMDAYQLVIDPFYLGSIICGSKDWKLARKAIIEIVGEVTPEEIFAADANAAIAKADLEAHQYDDGEAKKAIRGEIDGYKKQMLANEGLIDEYARTADVPEEEYLAAKSEDEQLSEQIGKIKAGASDPFAAEVSSLNGELFRLQNEYQKIISAPVDHTKSETIRKELSAKEDELAKAKRQKLSVEADIRRIRDELAFKKARQETLKAELKKLQDQLAGIMVEDICPTCGQKLPEEAVQEAFNKRKAEIMEKATSTREEAVNNKKAIEELQRNLDALTGRDFDTDINVLGCEIFKLEEQMRKALASEQASIQRPDPAIQARISEINKRLAEIRELQAQGSAGINEQVSILKAKKDGLLAVFSKRISFQNAQKRLAEIRAANVEIGKKQANAEQRLWAVGEFVKTKLSLLDQHMANKLGEVRFQLIKENIKAGSYDEICVPYIISPITGKHTSVLFPDGSKSEQIYTGIQIILAIRNCKGWSPLPVIFDQGGELDVRSTEKVSMDAEAQIIAVKVESGNTEPTFVPFDNN